LRIQTIEPFQSSNQFWLGLDEEGFRRKVFKVIDKDLVNSEHIVAGLTIFEPGESSSYHNHPDSEELDYIVRGSGNVISDDEEENFGSNSFMFIPKGVFHRHMNTGDEPMWMVFMYTPPGQLPGT
jgi:oxalate decarboxylase/phosphoglucose isomerase-like protein (cupin superfamily)